MTFGSHEIDPLLAPLAAPLRGAADVLLDFRESALRGAEAGRCVSCFFRVASVARAEARLAELCPLRQWLQDRVEIAAWDNEGALLETLPADFEAEDLPACCNRVMQEMLENRAYGTSRIRLGFRYRPEMVSAA